MSVLPAHASKLLPVLDVDGFSLCQLSDGTANGTTLWLGAQCLSFYLSLYITPPTVDNHRRQRVLELGSGIGYSALCLAKLGYDVVATDQAVIVRSVLDKNIDANSHHAGAGTVRVRELDWSVHPDLWRWSHPVTIASPTSPFIPDADPNTDADNAEAIVPPFDFIISSDTLYSPHLVTPLLRSLHAAARLSPSPTSHKRSVPVYLCIERRDPALIDQALAQAASAYAFRVDRVPHRKLARAVYRARPGWTADDWDGIEIYKLTLRE